MEELKRCTKCGEEKPANTEYFNRQEIGKNGLESNCKCCRKEYMKEYRKENKDKIKEYNKEYDKKHCKKIKEYMKEYHKENKDKRKEYRKQYGKENKDKLKEYNQKHREENEDKYRQYNQKRRALKKQLTATLTLEQWQQIKKTFNNICAYCGREKYLTQDHFIPITKGGEYTYNNIVPSCGSCNSSKRNKDFKDWYHEYEHYSKEREEYILNYLNNADLLINIAN